MKHTVMAQVGPGVSSFTQGTKVLIVDWDGDASVCIRGIRPHGQCVDVPHFWICNLYKIREATDDERGYLIGAETWNKLRFNSRDSAQKMAAKIEARRGELDPTDKYLPRGQGKNTGPGRHSMKEMLRFYK